MIVGVHGALVHVYATHGGLTYPADLSDRRIDYVTATSRARVQTVSADQTLASDHLLVVADLVVRRGS